MRIRYSTEKDGRPVKKAIVYTQDEHGINFSDVDVEAVNIVKHLRSHGYETYIVGGAIRDLILGKNPKDFDIVSEASPARIKKLFRNARIIGHRFRLVHVHFGSKVFEVSTFRSLKDGLTSNTFGTIEEDVLRRDFTLNALFYDPLKQIVVDYVEGMKDIQQKKIRPIIPLNTIFNDDPVRMIRAVKYSAAAGFKLPLFLKWKIKQQSHLLAEVSPSRLTEEMFKIIQASSAVQIVESLENLGLYAYLQPQASQLMKERSDFRKRYVSSLSTLSQEDGKTVSGVTLKVLIQDYLEDTISWTAETGEHYKDTFIMARRFVLPMNPPRIALDRAVRLIYKAHGIIIKRSRFPERESPVSSERQTLQPTAVSYSTGDARKRPLKRRRNTAKPGKVTVDEGESRTYKEY